MARVFVLPDSFNGFDALERAIEVQTGDVMSDWYYGECLRCRATITDRGHFEDTVQAIKLHLDKGC